MKICFTNLVYGEKYTSVFLNYHLKYFVDASELSALSPECVYQIFTDGQNIGEIKAHPNYVTLSAKLPVEFIEFDSTPDAYDQRYTFQSIQLKYSNKYAFDHDMFLVVCGADIIYGKGFWTKAITKISEGYDSILGVPIRTAFEGMQPYLDKIDTAPDADLLFSISFANQHTLWLSSNWDAPFFSHIPYQILWSDNSALVVRGFSISPLLYKPTAEMVDVSGCADISIIPYVKEPYFSKDWSEFPVSEIGFLFCWWPPFGQSRASTRSVAEWSVQAAPQGLYNLNHIVYIKRTTTPVPYHLIEQSDKVVADILRYRESMI